MSGPSPREWRDASSRDGEMFDDEKLRERYVRTLFDYKMPDDTLLYQVCRYDPDPNKLRPRVDAPKKKFLLRRPNPEPKWHYDDDDNRRWMFGPGDRLIPYNWPALINADLRKPVFVTEGEKNADDLIKCQRRFLATTVTSHKWTPDSIGALAGREVFILEDHDDSGRKYAADAYKHLSKVAKSVRIITAPQLWKYLPAPYTNNPTPECDISDWLDYGGNILELVDICREAPADGEIRIEPHNFPPEPKLARWDWLYGNHLLRGTVSATAASGGTGKTSLSIVESLAQASGKSLLKIQCPARPPRVLLINLEDDRNTMEKRVAAAMKDFGLTPEDIGGRLFIKAKGELQLKIANQRGLGLAAADELQIRGLINALVENKIDILSVDPLIATHRVNENDNSAMRDVIEAYDRVALDAHCAIHLWHHMRKTNGEQASVSSVRGASAIVDACRSVRVLETMTNDEGDEQGIKDPGRYFKEYSGKLNFAPPPDKAKWYTIKSVTLDNSPLFGDDVGVVTSWEHPAAEKKDAVKHLSPGDIEQIKQAIAEGRWRDDVRAEMLVGKAIAGVLGLNPEKDRAAIKDVIEKLVIDGVLKRVQGMDKKRTERMFVEVANAPQRASGGPEAKTS